MSKENNINKKENTQKIRVFKQFKKQKIFKQVFFVFWAFVLALWINSFVLNWNLSTNLKTSLLESGREKKSDIYIEKDKDFLNLKNFKQINDLKTLSFGLIYNPENIKIENILSNIANSKVIKMDNNEWITTVIINFSKPQTIKAKNNILKIFVSKKENTPENLNLINANFIDKSWNKYDLTTSSINF